MSQLLQYEPLHQSQVLLACYTCRKRKVKCGRELPCCTICRETSQQCAYPPKARRPGPKIGTTRASSYRRLLGRKDRGRSPVEQRNGEIRQHTQQDRVASNTRDGRRSESSAPPLASQNSLAPTDMLNLAYIIHPCFENCSPTPGNAVEGVDESNDHYLDELMMSCDCLGLTLGQLNILLPRYFEVYTAFQLFRLPEIQTKLRQIPTVAQRTALLASMLAFALKDLDHHDVNNMTQEQVLTHSTGVPSIHFRALAIKYMEQAMTELGDEAVTLPLLQAMILNTHCILVQGVRGRPWRYLGTCIRSAYELNLHLIDAGKPHGQALSTNAEQWCIEEEWRRAWWAIWEMDVFASFIRRCPTGIDWSQNETFLPAEDERWYRGEPQASCLLGLPLVNRWKSLVATQNQSPKAWFILINSLMKDAQNVSSPTSIDKFHLSHRDPTQDVEQAVAQDVRRRQQQKKTSDINRLDTVLNCLHCTVAALPKRLKYHGQYLNFGGIDTKRPGAITQRLTDSFVYGIYLMTQLTKMMVLKYHVFRTGAKWPMARNTDSADNVATANEAGTLTDHHAILSPSKAESQHLAQYFEAADNVVNIVRCCPEDHYKHLNPFLASTTWLSGAIQLLHRSLLANGCSDRELIDSKFELVSMTYLKAVGFWNMSQVPLRNWETIANGLENVKVGPSTEDHDQHQTPWVFTGGNVSHAPITEQANISSSTALSNANSKSGVIDQCFRYLIDDSKQRTGMAPDPAPTDLALASTMQAQQHLPYTPLSNNTYAPEHLLTQTQQSLGIMSSEYDAETVRMPSFGGTEAHPTFSPQFLDCMPFATDRAMNMDFSNYLDEILSGSYVP